MFRISPFHGKEIAVQGYKPNEQAVLEKSDHKRVAPWNRSEPSVAVSKIGRYEPCPCGSRKKYKKCCLK